MLYNICKEVIEMSVLSNPYLSKSKYNDKSYIGKIYGNFKVIDFVIDKDGRFAFKCMCLCQEGKKNPKYDIVLPSKLITGKRVSCGCERTSCGYSSYQDEKYIGKTFGDLTVVGFTKNKDGKFAFKCICKCQEGLSNPKYIAVLPSPLLNGRYNSCGCKSQKFGYSVYNDKSYIGRIYGNFKIVDFVKDKDGHFAFKCLCLCQEGKENPKYDIILPSKLINGYRVSCGCKKNGVKYNDKSYIGMTFGALTVLELIENNPNGKGVLFRCSCKHCGRKDVIVDARHFLQGRYVTCGNGLCKKKEDIMHSKYRDISYIGNIYGYLKVIDIIPPNETDTGVRWLCECQRDGNIASFIASAVVRGNNISCGCLNSTAEVYIKEILDKYKVNYKSEYSFKDLLGINGRRLRYDFAIIENGKLKCLIEYDGAQHRSVEQMYGSTYEEKLANYIRTKKHDKLKTEYAKKHNITLFRFYVRDVANNKDKVEKHLRDFGII